MTMALVVAGVGWSAASAAVSPAAPPPVPVGFQDSVAIDGLTAPTTFAVAPDGRVFVAQKNGTILVYPNLTDTENPTVFATLNSEVYDYWDRGMLGLAIDPGLTTGRPYLYVAYILDAAPGGTPPVYHDSCNDGGGGTLTGCITGARISRLTVAKNGTANTIDTTAPADAAHPGTLAGEKVLLEDWCSQYPSHSAGSLRVGPDGMLWFSHGEGASFSFADTGQVAPLPPSPAGGCHDPANEGGSLRAQSFRRAAGEPVSLDGTIIRINPDTGAAAAGNPNINDPNPNRRRIVAYGFRNPFRWTFRPGTNQLWVGDVGDSHWEEIDQVANPLAATNNYGWPCYEGAGTHSGFENAAQCTSLASAGTATTPFFQYDHTNPVSSTDAGQCTPDGSAVTGTAFYTDGTYPTKYHDGLFFADYVRGCIWLMESSAPGAGGTPLANQVQLFAHHVAQPIDLQVIAGDLYYMSFGDGTTGTGSIHRITYQSGDPRPTAVAQATPNPAVGSLPLTVQFDGSGSSDPTSEALTYSWSFGDGTPGTSGPTASHTYTTTGSYKATLTVTDTVGGTDTATIPVLAGAPIPTITTPLASRTWKVGDPITFSGSATDPDGAPIPTTDLQWTLLLHHCPTPGHCHIHNLQTFTGVASGTFRAPDHDYPSWLELILAATDPTYPALRGSTSVQLHPQGTTVSVATAPAGLQVSLAGNLVVAPAAKTVIVGSRVSVVAPLTESRGGIPYVFTGWSDGGAASHDVIAHQAQHLTAYYRYAGYWLVSDNGGVRPFGVAHFYGSMAGTRLTLPVVGMSTTPDKRGYWMVASDGGIFGFGDAHFYGSTGAIKLNQPIVGMTTTPSGHGYWMVASDGGIFGFGDAHFYGSAGGMHLAYPVVGMTVTPSGRGYWLVTAGGVVLPFGDARMYVRTGLALHGIPIVGMASTPSGHGYWLAGSDGSVYTYGDAGFHGSAAGSRRTQPIIGIQASSSGRGYWLAGAGGKVFTYGDAYAGPPQSTTLTHRVVGTA